MAADFSYKIEDQQWKVPIKHVWACGHLDSATNVELRAEVEAEIKKKSFVWACNLSELEYMSSAGISIFLNMAYFSRKAGGSVCLYSLSEGVRQVLNMMELTSQFEIYKNLEEAQDNFMQPKGSAPETNLAKPSFSKPKLK